jgi:protein-S-isoprenylcysteine O-methyltransferase Ste14
MIALRAAVYLAFLAVFTYVIAFLAGLPFLPKTIDSGVAPSTGVAVAIDLALLLAFALPHSVLARWKIDRSAYVLQSTLLLALVAWQWRPLPTEIWRFDAAWAQALVWILFALGWATVLYATFLIDHFEFAGLRRGANTRFVTPSLYRVVRHPMMLGLIIGVWATPRLTVGHALFAAAMTAYALIGTRFEERDLARTFGDDYRQYQARVPMILPWPRRR